MKHAILLFTLLLVLSTLPARAQHPAPDPAPEAPLLQEPAPPEAPAPQDTRVVFTLQSVTQATTGDLTTLPLSILERLSEEAHLANLELEGPGAARIRAQFVFQGMEAFTRWYASAPTRSLLEAFEAESVSSVQYSLSVNRPVR